MYNCPDEVWPHGNHETGRSCQAAEPHSTRTAPADHLPHLGRVCVRFVLAQTAVRPRVGPPRRGAGVYDMTKAELVDHVAERVQLPKYQTATVVTAVLQGIMDALRAGDKVELRGFSSFRLRRRPPRV